MMSEVEYLSVEEAAVLLRVDEPTLMRAIRKGLPAQRIGRHWRIHRDELRAWFAISSHPPGLAEQMGPIIAQAVAPIVTEYVMTALVEVAKQWHVVYETTPPPEAVSAVITLTVEEAAEQLRVSRWKVEELCRTRVLRHVHVGDQRIIPQSAIDEYVETAARPSSGRDIRHASWMTEQEVIAYARCQRGTLERAIAKGQLAPMPGRKGFFHRDDVDQWMAKHRVRQAPRTLGERLRAARERANLSFNYVWNNVGITPHMLGVYEGDKRVPDTKVLKKLAKAYGVTVEDLLGNPIPMPVS
ncbi:MAG TPA: excisionase family DNA-binding protein [Armatimonadota bacterium]|jgi:excisionase family DNA binding protein